MIPTEKAVRFLSAMFTICLFMFRVQQENYSLQTEYTEYTCPFSLLILRKHYRHIFTAIYCFHKINSSRHNNIMAFEISYYNAILLMSFILKLFEVYIFYYKFGILLSCTDSTLQRLNNAVFFTSNPENSAFLKRIFRQRGSPHCTPHPSPSNQISPPSRISASFATCHICVSSLIFYG